MDSTASKLAVLVLSLALLWAGLGWFERANLYIPSRELYAHPGTYGIPYEDLAFRAEDGAVLHGWYADAREPARKDAAQDPPLPGLAPLPGEPLTVVVFHGNGGNVSHRVQKLRLFRAMGLSVLLFDYRGYGRSLGRPDEAGTYRDGEAAVRLAVEGMGIPRERLVYYGESLGCAIALETALRLPPRALILDSPFTSTAAMAEELFPVLPARLLVRNRYDNLSKIGGISAPLLVVHSPEDEIVPFEMGQRLYEAAPRPKRFLEISGDHNGGFLDSAEWARGIREFLAK